MSALERTEQSLDWSAPENRDEYREMESQWGTYRVDSVSNDVSYLNGKSNLLEGIGVFAGDEC